MTREDEQENVRRDGTASESPASAGAEFPGIIPPAEIEARSFAIIRGELAEAGIRLNPDHEKVILRAIHATADFSYAQTLVFSTGVIDRIRELVRGGADIVTDTNMARAGISGRALSRFGGKVLCFMADEDVALEAKSRGITRAAVSMERAAALGRPLIFCIGNAPTALIRLHELTGGGCQPGAVIGVPVGFVNVCEAKELFLDSEIPHIINRGRKGGSGVAAAILNAVLYDL